MKLKIGPIEAEVEQAEVVYQSAPIDLSNCVEVRFDADEAQALADALAAAQVPHIGLGLRLGEGGAERLRAWMFPETPA